MARFTIQAIAASFLHCEGGPSGAYDMVSVAFGAPALYRETVDVKNLDQLRVAFDSAKATLANGAKPYSLSCRLVAADRAPRGWNDSKYQFRHDESFGIYENGKA